HGSFDVIARMVWLSQIKAIILCHEKVVEIPLEGSQILRVQGERTLGVAKALMNAKVDEPKVGDISVVRDFVDVFPEDFLGLPPQRQFGARIWNLLKHQGWTIRDYCMLCATCYCDMDRGTRSVPLFVVLETPLCCDDIHDVMPRVSTLAGVQAQQAFTLSDAPSSGLGPGPSLRKLPNSLVERGYGIAITKRRRQDFQSDGVMDLATASRRSRLKAALEDSTWRWYPFNVASFDGCACEALEN
ncbi:hypothetical protein Tco_0980803, partial [Tanacetum coccineum]